MTKVAAKKSILTILVVALVTALGLGFYFNRQRIFDYISAATFDAPAEISELEEKISLTDDAKTIYYASHPALLSQDAFNTACDSHDEEISVLGCYTTGRIHLYNIEDEELEGVVESTAAHELLHAVWERTSAQEKSILESQIADFYNNSDYRDLLAEDLETYDEADRIEELHSRIGTEIADLPAALEAHYAKYFTDQDAVVAFYDQYITPFRELSEEIDNLAAQLETMSSSIDQKTATYYQTADTLSADIDQFNSCASTPGCFTSQSSFYNQRNALISRQQALDLSYDELSELVDQYNSLVEEYNTNILRGETLEQAINSNRKVEAIEN